MGRDALPGGLTVCPAGELLTYRYTREQDGKNLRYYWTSACSKCPLKSQCTTGPERGVARWEHVYVIEAHRRLDEHPEKMRVRRETVEHPSGWSCGNGSSTFNSGRPA
jgi:hypothetical protein